MSSLLGVKVDLVMKGTLKPLIGSAGQRTLYIIVHDDAQSAEIFLS